MMRAVRLRKFAGLSLFACLLVGASDRGWFSPVDGEPLAQAQAPSPSPGRQMDHITGVSHIGLAVGDIEKSVDDLSYSEAGVRAAKERGDSISHFCLTTKDILADMAILKQRGVAFRDDPPRVGLTKKWISYTQAGTIGGLSFELLQPYPTPPSQ
jgi:hypothetical protein